MLAAGRSSRMAPRNKLLELIDGEPIVRRVAGIALASGAVPSSWSPASTPRASLKRLHGLKVTIVHNPAYRGGLEHLARAGLGALPPDSDGALILLGDMPEIESSDLER